MSWNDRSSVLSLTLVGMTLYGCGGDAEAPADADVRVDAGPLDEDCAGAEDGRPCGAGLICVSGACAVSACGDGVVDEAAGEHCEDGNEVAFDGCEPGTCTYTCTQDTECDDGQPCNGVEVCGASSHTCERGVALDPGTPCDRMDSSDGVCRGTGAAATCAAPGCGNGVVDGSEDCDDGNTDDGDGCDNDCTFSCETDADCVEQDMNVCDGADVCAPESHTCGPGTALDCDDGRACTDDSCDPSTGCANVDNGTGSLWYVDCDGDGYAFNDTGSERFCLPPTTAPAACTAGGAWTDLRPIGGDIDCLDSDSMVHPDSDTFRSAAISGAIPAADFDYNCDGVEEPERAVRGTCTCASRDEWYYSDFEGEALVCGQRQSYRWVCSNSTGSCVGHWERTRAEHIVRCR